MNNIAKADKEKIMGKPAKVPMYTAYVVLDAEGNWHTSDLGFLLSYGNKTDAITAMERYGGSKVVRCRMYIDGDKEAADVTPDKT